MDETKGPNSDKVLMHAGRAADGEWRGAEGGGKQWVRKWVQRQIRYAACTGSYGVVRVEGQRQQHSSWRQGSAARTLMDGM